MTGAPPAHPLDALFRPSAVAVVGASSDPRKRGFQAVRALLESGYRGRVLPVNPRGGTLLGLPVHPDLGGLPVIPELALVCTPAASVPEVLEACGAAGIVGAVVLAVGFAESDGAGRALEERVRETARRTGVRVVGPNTSGILNLPLGLNLVGARGVPAGRLALLVQSGNMALALMNEIRRRSSRGVSICVGVGNEVDLAFHEYLDFLGADPGTDAVMVHAEGMRDARAFLTTAARVGRDTPVALLKGARSEAGGVAARSHTGAVAGSYDVFRAGLRQAGVVEVGRSDELFHVTETLASQPPIRPGSAVAILSDGGGQATLAADLLSGEGVPLAELSGGARQALRSLLGSAAAVANPVDLAGRADAEPQVFASALEILLGDPAVGGVLVVGLFGGYALRFSDALAGGEEEAAAAMAEAARESGRALVVQTMYAPERSVPLVRLGEAGVPVVESLEVASRCIEALVRRGRFLETEPWEAGGAGGRGGAAPTGAGPEPVGTARREGRSILTEPEARRLLAGFGVPLAPLDACATREEAERAAASAGGPIVLKVVAAGIPHKTEAGGVALDVRGASAAGEAFDALVARARGHLEAAGAPVDVRGVLVGPVLPPPTAELLVGARREPSVGPVVTVGAGGVAVEVLRDVAHRVLPVSRSALGGMLRELRVDPLLEGLRGREGVDRQALLDLVEGVARCILEVPEVAEVEVNPVFAYPDRAVAVDARVFLT